MTPDKREKWAEKKVEKTRPEAAREHRRLDTPRDLRRSRLRRPSVNTDAFGVFAEQDRQANARAHADMEFLAREVDSLRMALGEVATRDYLRSELRGLLNELDERSGADEPDHTGLPPEAHG